MKVELDKITLKWTSGPAIVLYFAAAKLLLHLLTARRYGIFRDELYQVAVVPIARSASAGL
jgi:hypothetical protein